MTNETKIFDEYQVDCNECQSYWLDQCDGVKIGSQKACTAFKAIRRTNIPEQIKNLEKRLVRAETSTLLLAIAGSIYSLIHLAKLLGWL